MCDPAGVTRGSSRARPKAHAAAPPLLAHLCADDEAPHLVLVSRGEEAAGVTVIVRDLLWGLALVMAPLEVVHLAHGRSTVHAAGTGAGNVLEGTWLLTSAGPCVQRLVGDDGLGAADVTLADTPAHDATALDLLGREQDCTSGQSAEGRVEVVELEETAEQVRLQVGVEQLDGDQSCQGNPATTLTVELADPLGDRELVDSSVVPARPVAVAEPE